MSDAEREALAWLDRYITSGCSYEEGHATTLKAMLSEPRLPKTHEIGESAFVAMFHAAHKHGAGLSGSGMREAYRALYAHLTAPKTKEVEVWHVEFFNISNSIVGVKAHTNLADAEVHAASYRSMPSSFSCIRVTGPHKQTVPA